MKFTLTIECDNAAFTEYGPHPEVARLLRVAADEVEHGHDVRHLLDYNGNTVGRYEFRGR